MFCDGAPTGINTRKEMKIIPCIMMSHYINDVADLNDTPMEINSRKEMKTLSDIMQSHEISFLIDNHTEEVPR